MQESIKNWLRGMARPRMGRRLIALALSTTIISFCVAVFDKIGLGTDPCSTMNLGISRTLGLSFGTWQLLLNMAMLLVVIRFDASRIGVGTFFNMVLVGYIAEFFMGVVAGVPMLNNLTLAGRLGIFVPTMALFLVAASLYMAVDLGVGPYDAAPQILAAHAKKLSFRAIRVSWDVGVTIIGFLFGATVGLTTLVTGFCLGPAITAVGNRVKSLFE